MKELRKNKKIIMFGTGALAKDTLSIIPISITHFVDNNSSKWESEFLGVSVKSPQILLEYPKDDILIIIASSYYFDISLQLKEMGFIEEVNFFPVDILIQKQQHLPGHFYSPIPDRSFIKEKKERLFNTDFRDMDDINLNENYQKNILNKLVSKYYTQFPYWEGNKNLRYNIDNGFFLYFDAFTLYSMIRELKPKRIVEIGSGFSSALMLDINEVYFNETIQLTFVEPFPERFHELIFLRDSGKYILHEQTVQECNLEIFKELEENDVLFIDSSHVSKIGSDVNYIFFNILPILKKGVRIHFHDIFYPFEYPKEWVMNGRYWNEAYLLRAFLAYNQEFEIEFWTDYLGRKYYEELSEMAPITLKNTGGSLWIRKK